MSGLQMTSMSASRVVVTNTMYLSLALVVVLWLDAMEQFQAAAKR